MKNAFIAVLGITVLTIYSAASGPTVEQTQNKPDQVLRSNGRVNPSTLALELSIPLGVYRGRAGNGKPVTLQYSSKVWDTAQPFTWSAPYPYNEDIWTDLFPRFAKEHSGTSGTVTEGSHAGWTSSLGTPRIEFPTTDNYWNVPQDVEGQLWKEPAPNGNPPGPENFALYYVKRLNVIMPDGSAVEFRQDDTLYLSGSTLGGYGNFDWNGTYLSVDGSKMRLEIGGPQPVLYLPDGGRYLFGANNAATLYIDRNGNRTSFDPETRSWTDTLGRVLVDPFPVGPGVPAPTEGIKTFEYPGLAGQSQAVVFVWEKLHTQQTTLAYTADHHSCTPNNSTPIPSGATALFGVTDFRLRLCGQATPFDPVVLTEVRLANGAAYKFHYNLYGEMDRIEYPTGGYERLEYGWIKPLRTVGYGSDNTNPYGQFNRGIKKRWLSADGTSGAEVIWEYSVETVNNGFPATDYYRVVTQAPDGTSSEQYLYNESPESFQYPWGFGNIAIGRPYDERTYAAGTGTLASRITGRKLTKYAMTSNTVNGYPNQNYEASRDLRPEREVSIVFEQGASSALATMTETVYDTTGSSDPAYFSSLNPKQSKTYNYIVLDLSTALTANIDTISAMFSSSNLAAVTETDYLYDSNYRTRNISGLITENRIKDTSGNVRARTQISYDDANHTETSSGTMPTVASGTWVDPITELGSTIGSKRGLPTVVKTYYDIPNSYYTETHGFFDQYGNLRKARDGRGNDTWTTYDDDYAFAYPTSVTTPVPDPNGTYGSDAAFTTSTTFDYNTGLPLTVTDPNGAVTEMDYDDALLRPTKVTVGYGSSLAAETITEYGAGTSASTRWVKVRFQIDAEKWKEGYTWFDGLGRTIRTQSVDDAGDVFVMTCYDNMGRVSKVTNPFRGYTSQTCSTTTGLEWTTNTFDPAGRPWKVTTPDSAVVETTYSLATSGSQIGTVVTVEDQADKLRRSITNALGHLIRVDEPNSINALGNIDAPNQPTYYDYDLLSNLTKVRQGGTYSNPEQSRDFVYDALSRLKQATNPESGTIQYTYDSNSNLATKTDARGIVTTYTYDRLNRVTERSYAAPSPTPQNYQATPTANYYYDNLTNAKGKLIKVSSSVSTTEYTGFDILGRVTSHKQTTDGTDYTTAYVYNLAGALIEETYPSTRKVKNTLDSNGDLAMVQSKKNSASGYWSYANSFTYNPAGAVTSMQLGNGRWESTIFNSRLQPTETNLGTVQNGYDQLRLQYSYGDWVSGSVDATKNNGNIVQQVITVPTAGTSNGFTATQKYYYDPLNRIDDATEDTGGSQTWRQDFSYDRYGNRNFVEANTTTIPRLCGTSPNFTICTADHKKYNPGINTSNDNRINTSEDYAFDSSGNTTGDSEGRTFIYDGENKQVEVRDSGNNIIGQYVYDGDGKRIKKYVPATGETTIFVYDAAGKEIAEYSTIVASAQDAKVAYLTNDHLGSPRINTDQNGAVTARHDYHPFGEEITTSQRVAHVEYGGDSVRKQFTGYERDDETELDFAQARYYSSLSGRFFIPDDFSNDTDIFDPASWNLYAYVRNNPIKNIDPSGERIYIEFEDSDGNLQTVQYYRGKLYTTSKDKKGNLVRGAEYTGDNQYANDAKNYLNDLRTDQESELGKRISDLESNKLTNTIKKDPNDPGRDEAVATNPDALRKGIPTGTTVYWSDKPHPITAWDYAPSYIVPAYAALAHELLGHSWDANRGIDNPQDSFPVRPENGKPTFIPFGIREPAAVEIENQARRYAGDETRKWYGKYEIPKPPPPALKPGPGRPRRRGTR